MTSTPLKYLSQVVVNELSENISINRDRYASGDFFDLSRENGWEVESDKVQINLDMLADLDGTDGTAEADIRSSLIVYRSMPDMTPALAREERVWVRLTHVECLQYSRVRWVKTAKGENLDKVVLDHFFAKGRTGIRDDNAISRLWWNMHVATIADPDDPEGALRLILKTADIRQAIVERPNTASRQPLARAIVRAMRFNPWITSSEAAFREFMKEMNRDAGGVLFEAIPDSDADSALSAYAAKARQHLEG
ncbi:DUF6339 family protein [Pseudomonas sp. SDO5591_S426]